MRGLAKGDTLSCEHCGAVLCEATEDIPLGTMNWADKLRSVDVEMPAPGTKLKDAHCRCGKPFHEIEAILAANYGEAR